jgi:hypothetical protein
MTSHERLYAQLPMWREIALQCERKRRRERLHYRVDGHILKLVAKLN